MRTKRMFVALEVPQSCADTLVGLDPELPEVKWLPAEQLFLPMSMQWEMTQEEEQRLIEALNRVQVHPFFLPLQNIGVFGRPPAIAVSIGIGTGHPHFFALHRRIQDAALQAQLKPDLRPFHPHVTIARTTDTPKGKFQRFLREHADAELCLWNVTGFALYRVEESFDSTTFSVERRFPGS